MYGKRLTMFDESKNAPAIDAPIPGQSLTAPVGDRPWQRPPRFPTAEGALSFYIERITQERQTDQLLDLLELGVPVDSLVDTLQLGGVMEGLHSVDVGIIISPALAEVVSKMADAAEIDYTLTSEEIADTLPTKSDIALGIRHLKDRQNGVTLIDEQEEMPQEEDAMSVEEPEEKPMGLMARRQMDV